ncbi:hypothetical protein D3C80_1217260 [compost metagenome]
MLPIPSLPNAAFPLGYPAFSYPFCFRKGAGEPCLYQGPTDGIITIIWRQLPDSVQMIRHRHHGNDLERMLLLDVADDFAQQIDMADQQILLAIGQIDSEEPTGSAGLGAAIAH